MGMFLLIIFGFGSALLAGIIIIWFILRPLIRWFGGLLIKSRKPRQSSQSRGVSPPGTFDAEASDENADSAKPSKTRSVKVWLSRYYPELIAVGLTVGMVGMVAIEYDSLVTISEPPIIEIKAEKTIAVLLFSQSRNQPDDKLTERFSEDLLLMLAEVPELQVADRSLSFQFETRSWELHPGLWRQRNALKVNYVVEGQFTKVDDRLYIDVRLFDLPDFQGSYVWANTYVGDVSDIPRILSEIRASILEALEINVNSASPASQDPDGASN